MLSLAFFPVVFVLRAGGTHAGIVACVYEYVSLCVCARAILVV